MSLIPSTAIGAALTPVQRSTNEQLRARKVQSEKDYHHNEEVEELDERAVNSIDDHSRQREGQKEEEQKQERKKRPGERVEIASLEGAHAVARPATKRAAEERLDISA
jgi:hypothetical protein